MPTPGEHFPHFRIQNRRNRGVTDEDIFPDTTEIALGQYPLKKVDTDPDTFPSHGI